MLSSTPANGEYFVLGETVVFTEYWANNTGKTLYPFYVSIWPYEQPSRDSKDLPYSCSFDAEEPIAPGATGSHSLVTTVTEEDVARGGIYAMAFIWANIQDGPELEEVTTPFVTAPCGPGELPDADDPDSMHAAGLSVSWTYTNTPANGEFFTPGEVLNYQIIVTNTGSASLTGLSLGSSDSEAVIPSPTTLEPGYMIIVPYYKLVMEEHAKAGGITNYGFASGFSGDQMSIENNVSGQSDEVFAPCGWGKNTPDVYYVKKVANAPANGLFFTEGETIRYRVIFINNSKKAVTSVSATSV